MCCTILFWLGCVVKKKKKKPHNLFGLKQTSKHQTLFLADIKSTVTHGDSLGQQPSMKCLLVVSLCKHGACVSTMAGKNTENSSMVLKYFLLKVTYVTFA